MGLEGTAETAAVSRVRGLSRWEVYLGRGNSDSEGGSGWD